MLVDSPDFQEKRSTFFQYVFGTSEGFIALARHQPIADKWEEEYFRWPDDHEQMFKWLSTSCISYDLYYCPNLFERPKRNKESVRTTTCAWADLDNCPPGALLVEPTITVQSSPGRFQALWVFVEEEDPVEAEDISRRIAYFHQDVGADKSGWDLTQLLRVPFSNNHKYNLSGEAPTVTVIGTNPAKYTVANFAMYPPAKGYEFSEIPFPTDEVLEPLDASELLQRYRHRLMPTVWHLYETEPDTDSWSEKLWQLELLLFEGGMTREEVFCVAHESRCNKYRRDGRSPKLLWKEVCRAFGEFESRHKMVSHQVKLTEALLTDEERSLAEKSSTIVEEYIDWAKDLGDAAWQYHQAGAFVILSSLLAGSVRLPTSYGTVVPNLWFMILADTTLTRKTTAMDVAMDVIQEIDSDAVLATDGSIEGLFTSLSMRPGRPSVFLRDEFSGLLESMSRKDYYAGMAETLTKLYDGKFQKRVLRKETIEVRDPVLIVFAGGIRERVLGLLTHEHVASGFLPRFVFITAESDVTRLRPLGPPTADTRSRREGLTDKFKSIVGFYKQTMTTTVGGRAIEMPRRFDAELTPDAWARYNQFEESMLRTGMDSFHAEILTPSFDRLAKSGLKAAVLIAATQRQEERVIVREEDLIKAFLYVESWRNYTLEVLNNIGRTTQEKSIEQIRRAIEHKSGVQRSELMQFYHLTARDADLIFTTLEQRGQITRHRRGRGEQLYPINTGLENL